MRTRIGRLLLLVAIVFVPWMLYAPLLDNGIIDDDAQYLWGAPVHRLGDLPRLFTMDISKVWRTHHYAYDAYAGGSDYRPVGYLYFAALSPLFGLHAPAYRVATLLIYSLGTVLVLLFVYRLTGHALLAWLTAGLFAVDPVRIEYVFLLAFQGGMGLVLYLAAVLAYLAARRAIDPSIGWRWYGLSLFAALAAYFNHELAVSLPLALFLLEGWGGWLRREWGFRPVAVLPHGFLGGCYVLMRTLVERQFYPEKGRLVLDLTQPLDLLTAGIQMASRIIQLFLPTIEDLRYRVKVFVFGNAPGGIVLANHPLLALIGIGLLLAAATGLAWAATRPRIWRFIRHDPRGQWCLVAAGWSIMTLAPTVQYNGLAVRHLLMAAIGSNLLKALGIVALGGWAARHWVAARTVVVSLLAALLVLSSMQTITTQVRAFDEEDLVSRALVEDAVRLVRDAAVDDRPLIVYYLNGVLGNTAGVALQELVQTALQRDDIRVVLPYALNLRQGLADGFRSFPQVTIGMDEIVVVNHPYPSQVFGFVYYDQSAVRTGATIRNGDLYVIEVLETDEVRKIPRRFIIRYTRPPGTRVLFLKFVDGRLVRQELG